MMLVVSYVLAGGAISSTVNITDKKNVDEKSFEDRMRSKRNPLISMFRQKKPFDRE